MLTAPMNASGIRKKSASQTAPGRTSGPTPSRRRSTLDACLQLGPARRVLVEVEPEVEELLELVDDGLVRVDPGHVEEILGDERLGRLVRSHVADVVRVLGADVGVEQVVDEQVGRDRVL